VESGQGILSRPWLGISDLDRGYTKTNGNEGIDGKLIR